MTRPPDPVPPVRAPARQRTDGRTEQDHLLIRVSKGSGAGPTRLAAFDAALSDAGVAGYNLIRLSSVIPAYAVVREVPAQEQVLGAEGDVCYCVYAAAYASERDEQAWAGVAWAVSPRQHGSGLFVEHVAPSESRLRRDLDLTIRAMSLSRGDQHQMTSQTVSSAVCVDDPVCAVVFATYGTADWSRLLTSEG